MQHLEQAVAGLEQALHRPSDWVEPWRYAVRERLLDVAAALADESGAGEDGWLSARGELLRRERCRLLTRVGLLTPALTESHDPQTLRLGVLRLLCDLRHHIQRGNDLLYDAVSMEVGGSE